jgi:hypothetical protein
MIDHNSQPLTDDFIQHVHHPLQPVIREKKVEKIPALEDTYIRPKFINLINSSESWYQLLLLIGFEPGDVLPFSATDLWTLPPISPANLAASRVIGFGTQLVVTIDTRLAEKEEESRIRFEAEKVKQAQAAEAALKAVDEKRLRREQEEERAAEQLRQKFVERHQLEVEQHAQRSERTIAANTAIRDRLAQFRDVTKRLEDTIGTIPAEDLAEIKAFCKDPIFAEFLQDEDRDKIAEVSPTNLVDILNLIARHEESQRLASANKASTSSSISQTPHKAPASSSTSYPDIIDLSIGDEFDAGGKMVIDDYVKDFAWKPIGVKAEHVTPILYAMKKMKRSDKALFADDANVEQILALGVKALRDQQTLRGDSSAASDSSKRSHSQGPGGGSMERSTKRLKPQKKQVIDAAAFTQSVSHGKGKGKARRHTPEFTSSEDEGGDEGEDEDLNMDT